MRRIFSVLLCAALLVAPVWAAEEAEEGEKYLALTFDDGPSGRFTRRLLDGLAERGAKATFLLCGYRIADYPDEAQRIFAEGHEIGIHGYSHDSMRTMSRAEILREIARTAALLPDGCSPVFLRPPGGVCSDAVYAAAEEAGLAVLTWSVDPRDWATGDTDAVVRRVTECARDGDVILLHDMSESSVDAALAIVDALSNEGFQFVTASELAAIRGEAIRSGALYARFP